MHPFLRSLRATLILAIAGVLAAGCARTLTPSGPVISPTGIEYALGTPPVDTRYSQTAVLYLRQERIERALELALEGIEADPPNPIHYYLAGAAYARLGRTVAADSMFVEAERIYPAYELDIEPEREQAWAEAFNEGIEAFGTDDIDGALEAWRRAAAVYDLQPDAHRNLAVVLSGEGRYDEAADIYQEALAGLGRRPATRLLTEEEVAERGDLVLEIEGNLAQLLLFSGRFPEAEPLLREQLGRRPDDMDLRRDLARALTGMGRDAEATELYISLLSAGVLDPAEIFNVGVALFRSGDFAEAGTAFRRLTELQPDSRDAWFNYANSLFAAEAWGPLAAAGDRLIELDPLSENAGLIRARAYFEMGDEEAARAGLEQTELLPAYVEGLRLQPMGPETRLEGRIVGREAEPATELRLRFTFYGDEGLAVEEFLAMPMPSAGEIEEFELALDARATAYRYEVLP